jgi:hypothetical protein
VLDSFNNDVKSDNKGIFDAREHISSLCENGRVRLEPHAKILYNKGWVNIIEKLMIVIKRHPIDLKLIYAEYAQLDVSFSCYDKTQEVKVWRAIDYAKIQSRETCMECGGFGRRRLRGENLVVMCNSCIHVAETNGVTGTWLDKY